MNAIIASVTFRTFTVLAFLIFLSACNRAPETTQAVRDGILDHLGKNTGLDLKSMEVDIRNVSFEGDKATATVSFKPKSSPDAGMSMNYTLAREGKKWIVQRSAGSGGHAGAAPQQSPASPGGGELPAGHPPVASPGGSELPSGHPPVNPPPVAPKK